MTAAQKIPSIEDIRVLSPSLLGIHIPAPPKRSLEEQNCAVLTELLPKTDLFALRTVNSIPALQTNETPQKAAQFDIITLANELFGDSEPLQGEAITILQATIRRISKTKTLPSYR
jgi:hypothetical protein